MNVRTMFGAVSVACLLASSSAFADPSQTGASCPSLTEEDRESAQKALAQAQYVKAVKAERRVHAKTSVKQTAGAELYVPAQRGLSAQWLERAIACGAGVADMGSSPFGVQGVKVSVEAARRGYVVRITADKREVAEEVVRRAELAHATASR
jgi:hypothetical protein